MTAVYIHNVIVLIAVNFVSNLIIDIGIYIYIMKVWKPNAETDPALIGYGKHISYMNFFGTLANQLDKILVFHWMGAVELAIYSFAIAIPEQIKGSYKNLFSIALPKMTSADPKLLRASVLDKFYRLTAITVVVVVAYYFAAPYIYQVFFPKYLASVWYSQVYMLGLITVPGIALFGSYFQVKQDTATLYKITLAGNAVTIFLTAVLIYSFGLAGAVIENGTSWLVMLLIGFFFFLRDKPSVSV
jgi:O-antigen/teichoic acid export membrane protein